MFSPLLVKLIHFFWTAESQKAASGSHHSIEFYFALLCLPHRWHCVAVVVYVIPLISHSDAFRSTAAPPSTVSAFPRTTCDCPLFHLLQALSVLSSCSVCFCVSFSSFYNTFFLGVPVTAEANQAAELQ